MSDKVLLFKKPYVFWFIGIFILYLILSILISGFYNTIPLIVIYASTISWFKLGASLLLTIVIGLLVSANAVYFYVRYKGRKKCKEGGIVVGAGTIGGFVVGVCPLCVTGIFPLILSLAGISFSFASLPFQGLEIQALIVLLLGVGLWMINRR